MDIDYGLKISLLSDEDGGGYLVEVPDLPGCMTNGDTLEEAIKKAGEAIESWIQVAKECGKKIPEKKYYSSEDDYSGKLTLRMPKSLHKELAQAAEEQGVSINQLILYFLSKSIGQVKTETASTYDRNKTCINFERTLLKVSHDKDWEPNSFLPVFHNRKAPMIQHKRREGQ